jgi:hypothetical protein
LIPKYSDVRSAAPLSLVTAGARTSRSVISRKTAPRGDTEDDIAYGPHAVGLDCDTLECECTATPAKNANL